MCIIGNNVMKCWRGQYHIRHKHMGKDKAVSLIEYERGGWVCVTAAVCKYDDFFVSLASL